MPDLIQRPRIDRTVRRIVERIDESTQLIDQAMSGFRSGLRGAPIRPHREGDSATLGRECRAALTDDRDLDGVRFHGFEFRTKAVATAAKAVPLGRSASITIRAESGGVRAR